MLSKQIIAHLDSAQAIHQFIDHSKLHIGKLGGRTFVVKKEGKNYRYKLNDLIRHLQKIQLNKPQSEKIIAAVRQLDQAAETKLKCKSQCLRWMTAIRRAFANRGFNRQKELQKIIDKATVEETSFKEIPVKKERVSDTAFDMEDYTQEELEAMGEVEEVIVSKDLIKAPIRTTALERIEKGILAQKEVSDRILQALREDRKEEALTLFSSLRMYHKLDACLPYPKEIFEQVFSEFIKTLPFKAGEMGSHALLTYIAKFIENEVREPLKSNSEYALATLVNHKIIHPYFITKIDGKIKVEKVVENKA